VNKPVGDNGPQVRGQKTHAAQDELMGKTVWTKRSKKSGQFVDQKCPPKSSGRAAREETA
jgi:hypothetical protein